MNHFVATFTIIFAPLHVTRVFLCAIRGHLQSSNECNNERTINWSSSSVFLVDKIVSRAQITHTITSESFQSEFQSENE